MPCEACNVQFTVFKRKRPCTECRRLYCSNCLTKTKDRALCQRCIVFTARPISKIELLKLKAKDLIFYLQSKHISTTGCVEKEELVNLVLTHVNNVSTYSPNSNHSSTFSGGSGSERGSPSNPFDQLKNTCQNLFTTFTEKIAADLNFDLKPTPNDRQTNVCEDQPRYSQQHDIQYRYQPPYGGSNAGSQTSNVTPNVTTHSTNVNRPTSNLSSPTSPHDSQSPTTTSSGSSSPSVFQTTTNERDATARVHQPSVPNVPKCSSGHVNGSGEDRRHPPRRAHAQAKRSPRTTQLLLEDVSATTGSGCECSDDEIITKFQRNYREKSVDGLSKVATKANEFSAAGPSSSSASSSTQTGNSSDTALKEDGTAIESSDVSSFEDLGAVGGCIATTSTDADAWQFVNRPTNSDETPLVSPEVKTKAASNLPLETITTTTTTLLPNEIADTESDTNQRQLPANPTHSNDNNNIRLDTLGQLKLRNLNRKIVRRRSDGIVYMSTSGNATHNLYNLREDTNAGIDGDDDDDDDDDEDPSSMTNGSSSGAEMSRKRTKKSCHKCGKTKGDLKKYIARFRRQLETKTNSTETEIKQQLEAFLRFLELRSQNSMDDGKDESPISMESPTMGGEHSANDYLGTEIIIDDFDDDGDDVDDDYDAGIHVYGTESGATANDTPTRQFFNLRGIESRDELEDLSVKQLKEILMLNRIDFKGCCEKSELLERVQRLWTDLQSCPAVEKLPTGDLCKICMDAAIECVLLECGHMATCTNCGKVLSECPICRQYIVRVVRFFKA